MMRLYRMFMISGTMMVLTLLAGCGPGTIIGGADLPIAVTNRSLTTSNDPAGTVRTGPVTLHTNALSYVIKATIFVTLSNQSNHTLYFPDHLTNCTVILLQRQKVQPLAGENGQAGINPCRLGIATRIHSLDAGQRLVVRLVAPFNGWLTGFYRATLSYRTSLNAGPSTTIYSAAFTVGPLVPQEPSLRP